MEFHLVHIFLYHTKCFVHVVSWFYSSSSSDQANVSIFPTQTKIFLRHVIRSTSASEKIRHQIYIYMDNQRR